MGGLGPMSGQAGHFRNYAPEKIQYGIDRYTNEVNRLYGVLDRRLEGRDYIAGDYSIADMACIGWVNAYKNFEQNLDDFPNLKRWHQAMNARPAVQRGLALGKEERERANTSADKEEERKILFGQKAR